MKIRKYIPSVLLVLSVLSLTAGCSLFSSTATPEQKQQEVHNLAYAAASIGADVTLQFEPQYRQALVLARDQLSAFMAKGGILNGSEIRNILAKIPQTALQGKKAAILIQDGTFLLDILTGNKITIESQPYLKAFAQGVLEGLNSALGPPPSAALTSHLSLLTSQ